MIKGHSNYKIEFFYDGEYIVKKSIASHDDRLFQVANKQKKFPHSNLYIIPEVFEINISEESTYFTMSYINANNFIEHFNKINLSKIDGLINHIISIIVEFIDNSTIMEINSDIISDKYLKTKKEILKNNISLDFEYLDSIFLTRYNLNLPIGRCHGDITLSNILFDNDDIYLIDFLDSFLESPIVDIAKLRQDTKFNWSSCLYDKYFDMTKLKIILEYFDDKIHKYFSQFEFYKKHYKVFEILNILRVLQYAKDESIIKKLTEDIKCVA
jgi:hypothetical protein